MINFIKGTPSPEVLEKLAEEKSKSNGTYNIPEVVHALKEEFHDKCYICEQKNIKSINIEHFKPHKGSNKELMFDWNNLYYACGHCNNLKLAKYDNILDPGNPEEDVEESIHYGMPILHKRAQVEITACIDNEKTHNTVELLNYVYNGKTAIKDIEAVNIKNDLVKELVQFTSWLREYDDDELEEDEKDCLKRNIRKGLNVKSAFTAFKRQIVKDTNYLYEEFKDYI